MYSGCQVLVRSCTAHKSNMFSTIKIEHSSKNSRTYSKRNPIHVLTHIVSKLGASDQYNNIINGLQASNMPDEKYMTAVQDLYQTSRDMKQAILLLQQFDRKSQKFGPSVKDPMNCLQISGTLLLPYVIASNHPRIEEWPKIPDQRDELINHLKNIGLFTEAGYFDFCLKKGFAAFRSACTFTRREAENLQP